MTLRLAATCCLFVAMTLAAGSALAVNCTPDDITLNSQQAVDDFQLNHGPGCDRVVGDLTISGPDITNLAGLAGLESVYWVYIINNPALSDLTGLESITTATGPIDIWNNTSLTSLDGLSGLTSLGGSLTLLDNFFLSDIDALGNLVSIGSSLFLSRSDGLSNLDGLTSLTSIGFAVILVRNGNLENIDGLASVSGYSGDLVLRDNPKLASLDGIAGVTEMGGLIVQRNNALTNLDALSGLTKVRNNYSEVFIDDNDALTDISGLADLIDLNAGIEVTENSSLADCSPLARLLDPVDDALPGPGPGNAGIPDVNGVAVFSDNLPGCNSVPEIVDNPPLGKTVLYGGLDSGRDQLLMKGAMVTYNCLEAPILTPSAQQVSASRLSYTCGATYFEDTETLVYDLNKDRCQTLDDFTRSTNLFTHSVYAPDGMAGATLEQATDVIFNDDPQALLQFDPASGDLTPGKSMLCGKGLKIFNSDFEP